MGLNRNVPLSTALRYKGQGPYLAFILHRIGGSALFILFTFYILTLAGVGFASAILRHWAFQIVFLPFALFHAINGLRITILDLWPNLIPHLREAVWVEWAIFIPVYSFAVFVILTTALGG